MTPLRPTLPSDMVRLAIIGDASSPNVLRWAEGLGAAGANVAIASFERPPPSWPGEVLPLRPATPGKLRYVAAAPALRALLRRWNPDVTAGYFVTGYGLLAALARSGRLVQVGVGSDLLTTDPRQALGRVVRFSLRRADLVLVWSDELAERARLLGARPGQLLVQPRGIPVDEFTAGEPATEALTIVSTRSLKPLYRIDVLIDAMAHLPHDAALTIVGDGPSRGTLEERVRRSGLSDRVTFLGARPNHEIPALLKRHRVHVSLAPRDGVSASLLEAMASSVVPVAIDNAANRVWITNGATGILLGNVTPQSVAAGVVDASSAELRATAIERNHQVVRERGDLYANAARTLERMNALCCDAPAKSDDGAATPTGTDRRLGIVFLIRELTMGGAERQLVQLAVGLAGRGHRIEVAVLRAGGVLEETLRQHDVEVHDLSAEGGTLAARLRRLAALVRRTGVDVLHSYLPGQNVLAALVRPVAPSVCIVWGVRASRFSVSGYHNARARLSYGAEPYLSRLADLVVTNSDAAHRGPNAGRYPPGRTVTIPNGIDTDHFRPDAAAAGQVRTLLKISSGSALILSVGQLDPVKGHDVLLEAAAALKDDHPEWRYLVIGRGPDEYWHHLSRRAHELDVAGQILWRSHDPDLRAFYAAADVLCLPSRAEGFPNVVGEAMACGTPCVATDVGDVAAIIADTGVVVPPEDPMALAAGLEAGITLPMTAGARSRARILKAYSVGAMVERTESALVRAVVHRRSR